MVNLAFLWKKLSELQLFKNLTRKTALFEGWSKFKFNSLGLALGTNLKFYTSLEKGLKLKVRKFWGLFPTFVEVTEEKLVGSLFTSPLPSILNRVNNISNYWINNSARAIHWVLLCIWHNCRFIIHDADSVSLSCISGLKKIRNIDIIRTFVTFISMISFRLFCIFFIQNIFMFCCFTIKGLLNFCQHQLLEKPFCPAL